MVHEIIQTKYNEVHHLLQEIRMNDGRFQSYFHLSVTQFDDLPSPISPRRKKHKNKSKIRGSFHYYLDVNEENEEE